MHLDNVWAILAILVRYQWSICMESVHFSADTSLMGEILRLLAATPMEAMPYCHFQYWPVSYLHNSASFFQVHWANTHFTLKSVDLPSVLCVLIHSVFPLLKLLCVNCHWGSTLKKHEGWFFAEPCWSWTILVVYLISTWIPLLLSDKDGLASRGRVLRPLCYGFMSLK